MKSPPERLRSTKSRENSRLSLPRRERARGAPLDGHPLGERTCGHEEAAGVEVVAQLAIEGETVGVDPHRDRGVRRAEAVDRAGVLGEGLAGRLVGLAPSLELG